MKLLNICVIGLWCTSFYLIGFGNKDQVELQSVFHHLGMSPGKNNDLHIASLIFYFNQDPIMNVIPGISDRVVDTTHRLARFFFPYAKIKSSGCQSMINALTQHESNFYKIVIQPEQRPVPGIALIITYDPQKISFYHVHFNPREKFSGIVFRFYNKDILQTLSERQEPVLRLVQKKKPCVVIDCGHGGRDPGATVKDILEKRVTLAIGKQLAHSLQQGGYHVVMTRNRDIFVPLDKRTSIANKVKADLFISLHANYAHRNQVSGIETYHLPLALIQDHTRVVYGDNTILPLVISQERKRMQESQKFAQLIHSHTYQAIRKDYPDVIDRLVKQKPLQVLMGTTMPAILIELGFLTNPQECARLNQKPYQKLLIAGMHKAILQYS